ncbi:MAG: hypothetical protein JSS02_03390 [Planctomycetes bacterium]|nr:hypothetical protein [Planctomycetota bacterium]
MKDFVPIVFALLTGLFWGTYGPVLAESRTFLKSPFKPYVAIGIAYLIWGIGGGIAGMLYKNDKFEGFTGPGMLWGLAAGTLGAWGALTLTLAMFNGGKPYVVMPIVFGSAVTVAALVGVWQTAGKTSVNPMLWVGILGIVVCAAIVAYNTPHVAPHAKPAEAPAATTGSPGPS